LTEDRTALLYLRDAIGEGDRLFDGTRRAGCERIVSNRLGSR
jgi:hypothetical protein